MKDDAQSMVFDYRVFVLTGPKIRLTAAIDTELAVVAKLRALPGADTAKLDAIEGALKGKVDTLLAIKPGPDGDALRPGPAGPRRRQDRARRPEGAAEDQEVSQAARTI